MKAVVAVAGNGLTRLIEVDSPVPDDDEVLIDVSAISVNRGELHRLRGAQPGWRPGWDFAGTVAASRCHDRTSFIPGQRVFGIAGGGGAWAEQVVVPADHLAPLPADLDDEIATALPVAGLTAQRVLRLAGKLPGRHLLVTGAAGGVGRFAVQLAAEAGAEVTAVVRDEARAAGLTELGSHRVVTDLRLLTRDYDVVLESVGGASMESALDLVAREGLVVSFGNSARIPATLPVARFYPKQAVLRGYYLLDDIVTHPPARDLATLAHLAARGSLRVDIDMVLGIEALPQVLCALSDRLIAGKAVLRMR
ncbi:zinc-binding dehydrogenase [Amycolatopsis palatopharyngis]|uniref:zinc-binding dehydrogenase n=1 Tax=Amycolatopsis palatopharyngis TaxID=187982 RepID=UPI0013BE9839|nr:zinc-binding dehydrogenase [Amycolatopsis palatopharyngis]